jgi:hypothetical protein
MTAAANEAPKTFASSLCAWAGSRPRRKDRRAGRIGALLEPDTQLRRLGRRARARPLRRDEDVRQRDPLGITVLARVRGQVRRQIRLRGGRHGLRVLDEELHLLDEAAADDDVAAVEPERQRLAHQDLVADVGVHHVPLVGRARAAPGATAESSPCRRSRRPARLISRSRGGATGVQPERQRLRTRTWSTAREAGGTSEARLVADRRRPRPSGPVRTPIEAPHARVSGRLRVWRMETARTALAQVPIAAASAFLTSPVLRTEEMLMTDADLGKLVHAAFDEAGFVDTIRERLRKAVAAAIGDGAEAGVRAGHAAGEQLATVLIARGRDARMRPAGADEVERRATAFRAMAGVRV